MVVVARYDGHAAPFGEASESIDRAWIRACGGAYERRDRPARARFYVDVKFREKVLETALRRRHPGQLENVADKDQLGVLARDAFAQRRERGALAIVAKESRVAVLVQVEITDDVHGHGAQ